MITPLNLVLAAGNAVQLVGWTKDAAKKASKTKLAQNIKKSVEDIPESAPVKAVRDTKVAKAIEKGCTKAAEVVLDQLSPAKEKVRRRIIFYTSL